MTIARIKDSGTTPIADGTTYDPAESGSDQGVDTLILLRGTIPGSALSDFQLNSVNFVEDQTILEAALLSFDMYLVSGTIVESAIPASGTFDVTIDDGATGEGGLVSTVSGMLQTGTITSDMQLGTFQSASPPTHTVVAAAGDKITMLYESNGGTDSLPSDLATGDTWVERATGSMTGSPLNQGKIWDVLVTGAVNESIGGSDILSGSNSGSMGTKVTKGSVGGAAETITADSGSYAYTGTTVPIIGALNITSDAGSYTQTGTDVNLRADFNASSDSGAYLYTGTTTPILGAFNIVTDTGAYVYTGTDVTLVDPVADETLIAEVGAYIYTGTTIPFGYSARLVADTGNYTYTGTDIDLRFGSALVVDAGSYAYTGANVDLDFVGNMTVEAGSYIINGTDVTLSNTGAAIWIEQPITPATYIDQAIIDAAWADNTLQTTTWTDN